MADSVEQSLARALTSGGHRLALAESCTGGLIAHRLTRVPGSSEFLDCGLVVYSNRAKMDLLGVSRAVIDSEGAVSEACAKAMLEGLFKRVPATLGAAVTGIAGPTGGSPAKPVGTVWVAWGDREKQCTHCFRFSGSRTAVMASAAERALNLLSDFVGGVR